MLLLHISQPTSVHAIASVIHFYLIKDVVVFYDQRTVTSVTCFYPESGVLSLSTAAKSVLSYGFMKLFALFTAMFELSTVHS